MWVLLIQVELEFGDVGFCGGRKTQEPREKPSEQGENNNKLNPCMALAGWNQTWAILMRGEHSYHCTRGVGGGGYSRKFRIGVCHEGSSILTLKDEANEN